jgi:hypothetical protein
MAITLNTTTYRKDKLHPTGHGYGPARPASQIKAVLFHTTNNPRGNTHYASEARFLRDSRDVSCHYVVSSHDATVAQILPDTLIAWHSGDCADNDYQNATSIGIEIAWAPQAGDLPPQAIQNTTDLVKMLLARYPNVRKVDTHRAQAVPAGRKSDPAGWSDAAFYAWRSALFNPTAPFPGSPPPSYRGRWRLTQGAWVRSKPWATGPNKGRHIATLRAGDEISGELQMGEVYRGVEDWIRFFRDGREMFVWAGQTERIA